MAGFVLGDILDPYMNVACRRPRSLSNMMNRTNNSGMPANLRYALESGLNPDRMRGFVHWIYERLDPKLKPGYTHLILSKFEDTCALGDPLFAKHMPFFEALRPSLEAGNDNELWLRFQLAVRLAWLGLHAIFGINMGNLALTALKEDPACSEYALWESFLQSGQTDEPVSFSEPDPMKRIMLVYHESDEQPDLEKTFSELNAIAQEGQSDPEDAFRFLRYAGWYLVANWTDPVIALNDTPRATYHGATLLGQIPNGTPVYIQMASAYNGLNKSSGCWGLTRFNDMWGYVPMTHLMKIRPFGMVDDLPMQMPEEEAE